VCVCHKTQYGSRHRGLVVNMYINLRFKCTFGQYVVILVTEPIIFSPVARQQLLPWQKFCVLPSMKLTGPAGTELLQFFSGYVT